MPLVFGYRNAKEIWEKLEKAYKSKCAAAEHSMRARSMNFRMRQEDSIHVFANKICSIAHELSYTGYQLSEKDKKCVIERPKVRIRSASRELFFWRRSPI